MERRRQRKRHVQSQVTLFRGELRRVVRKLPNEYPGGGFYFKCPGWGVVVNIINGLHVELSAILEKKTFKRKLNYILASIQYRLKKNFISTYPVKMTIDPSNYGTLQYELCPTGTHAEGRTHSMMEFDTFKKAIDECATYLQALIASMYVAKPSLSHMLIQS